MSPVLPERSDQREAQRERSVRLVWGRDPFAWTVKSRQGTELNLSGILWDASQPIAIINGRMLYVGEALEGYRVVEISHDRVSVTDGAQTFQLFITP
jgi:hypothetical protein